MPAAARPLASAYRGARRGSRSPRRREAALRPRRADGARGRLGGGAGSALGRDASRQPGAHAGARGGGRAGAHAALVHELVDQLSRMRGAAMKVGQIISMVDFEGLPEDQQDELQQKLATLRDNVPPVTFARLEKLLRKEFGAPLSSVFSEFDERAFAAASIGQVHRATTLDGAEVVVKVQYPGVAEAVETDLRNAMLLSAAGQASGPRPRRQGLGVEMRERIGEELDYELEAQHQRRIERLMRGHPFMRVPRVYTDLSTRRVLGFGVRRGRALRGGAPSRGVTARPLRGDRVPVLLRTPVSRPHRARRSAPGQLPAVSRRASLLPRLRPAARRRARQSARRADDRAGGSRERPGRAEGGPGRRWLPARGPCRRRGRGLRPAS